MKKYFKKITPRPVTLIESKWLKPVAHLLGDPKVWHFNRKTIASGVAIGVLVGFLPIPFQMLLATILAIMSRVNLPVSVAMTWITNPLTIPFVFTANYYVGAWVLDKSQQQLPELHWSLESILNLSGKILIPLYLGSLIMGAIFATLAFVIVRGWWRYSIVRHYRLRKSRPCCQNNIDKKQ